MKLVTFIDSIGRTILGVNEQVTDTVLRVKNPAMINVAQAQNGQLQVQLIPLFFSEFIADDKRSEGSVWSFNLSQITIADVEVDARLTEQYIRISTPQLASQTASADEPVIKLFDE
jgi:hypothetical protein